MLTLARSYLLGFSIYVLRQLRHILPREQRQSLMSALIISRIDCCNTVLAGLPANTLAPLKRLLNACARFVANLKSRDHVTSTFHELHWLPIEQRITCKLCTLMHGIAHGYAPRYLTDIVTPVSSLPSRSYLRSASLGLFDVPRTRIRQGAQAFSLCWPYSLEQSTYTH